MGRPMDIKAIMKSVTRVLFVPGFFCLPVWCPCWLAPAPLPACLRSLVPPEPEHLFSFAFFRQPFSPRLRSCCTVSVHSPARLSPCSCRRRCPAIAQQPATVLPRSCPLLCYLPCHIACRSSDSSSVPPLVDAGDTLPADH